MNGVVIVEKIIVPAALSPLIAGVASYAATQVVLVNRPSRSA